MKKIIIIGACAMGSAFAVPCVENKNDVTIVGTHLEDNLIKDIISNDLSIDNPHGPAPIIAIFVINYLQ